MRMLLAATCAAFVVAALPSQAPAQGASRPDISLHKRPLSKAEARRRGIRCRYHTYAGCIAYWTSVDGKCGAGCAYGCRRICPR